MVVEPRRPQGRLGGPHPSRLHEACGAHVALASRRGGWTANQEQCGEDTVSRCEQTHIYTVYLYSVTTTCEITGKKITGGPGASGEVLLKSMGSFCAARGEEGVTHRTPSFLNICLGAKAADLPRKSTAPKTRCDKTNSPSQSLVFQIKDIPSAQEGSPSTPPPIPTPHGLNTRLPDPPTFPTSPLASAPNSQFMSHAMAPKGNRSTSP